MRAEEEFDNYADTKFEQLKARSFEDLSKMDGHSFTWSNKKRSGKITVAIENVDENTIRVILQGFLPGRFFSFIKHAFVDGFRKKRDGKVEAVTYEEISYYD